MRQSEKETGSFSLDDLLAAVGGPSSGILPGDGLPFGGQEAEPEESPAARQGSKPGKAGQAQGGKAGLGRAKQKDSSSFLDDLLLSMAGPSDEGSVEKGQAEQADRQGQEPEAEARLREEELAVEPRADFSLDSLFGDDWGLDFSLGFEEPAVERPRSVRSKFADYGKPASERQGQASMEGQAAYEEVLPEASAELQEAAVELQEANVELQQVPGEELPEEAAAEVAQRDWAGSEPEEGKAAGLDPEVEDAVGGEPGPKPETVLEPEPESESRPMPEREPEPEPVPEPETETEPVPEIEPGSMPESEADSVPEPGFRAELEPGPEATTVPDLKSELEPAAKNPSSLKKEVRAPRRESVQRRSVKSQRKEGGAAKTAGMLFVAAAVVCAIAAVCLMSGVVTLPSSSSSTAQDSEAQRGSSPAAFSAESQTYEYSIAGLGGETYKVTETATFSEAGYLQQSDIVITVPSQEAGEKMLGQLEKDFGDSLTKGKVSGQTVTLVVKANEEVDSETYAQLMGEIAK